MIPVPFRRLTLGFTLIEILVVCAVVAVTLGLVMIKLDPSDSQRLNAAVEILASRLEAARDEAVIRGEAVAFSSDGQGYQFWRADTEHNVWVALPDTDTVVSGRLAEGVVLRSLQVNGKSRPLGERLVFSFSGLVEPFDLTLSNGSSTRDIRGDALGRINIHRAP